MNIKEKIFHFFFLLIAAIFISTNSGCGDNKPVRIGFIGTISGLNYDLAVSVRNGALLAIEKANETGGCRSRMIELVIRDNKNNPDIAMKNIDELISNEAIAIIGPMRSSMAKKIVHHINQKKIIFLSPTISSSSFSSLDDNLIKIFPDTTVQTNKISSYAIKKAGIKSVSVIADSQNMEYSEKWISNFRKSYTELGGRITEIIYFRPDQKNSLKNISYYYSISGDAVLILANSMHTGIICQHLKKANPEKKIIISGWGATSDIIVHGGKSVEGAIISHTYNPDSTEERYKNFRKKYYKRFSKEPDFASVKGYEAADIIVNGCRESVNPADLKKTIVKIKKFDGLQKPFEIDKFGDVHQDAFILTVKNGKFILIEE